MPEKSLHYECWSSHGRSACCAYIFACCFSASTYKHLSTTLAECADMSDFGTIIADGMQCLPVVRACCYGNKVESEYRASGKAP